MACSLQALIIAQQRLSISPPLPSLPMRALLQGPVSDMQALKRHLPAADRLMELAMGTFDEVELQDQMLEAAQYREDKVEALGLDSAQYKSLIASSLAPCAGTGPLFWVQMDQLFWYCKYIVGLSDEIANGE